MTLLLSSEGLETQSTQMAQVNCGRLEIFMSQGKGGRYAKLLFRLNEQKCKIYTLLCGGCLFPATHEPSVLKS